MEDERRKRATYLVALNKIKGIGRQSAIKIATKFPEPDDLISANSKELSNRLSKRLASIIESIKNSGWNSAWNTAKDQIEQHLDSDIKVVTIHDAAYPTLLEMISDPPAILYVRGSLPVLRNKNMLAIIGTRHPTPLGEKTANRISRHFAEKGYVIVSGLATGIDTAAHKGALEVNGQTIAVLGTSIDKIYPQSNKSLAINIEANGAVISEIGIGEQEARWSFVQRDRIQSGLSIGIIAVQTDISGGTMHTISFAEKQKRLIFCPLPISTEKEAKQYSGINKLIESHRATVFSDKEYENIADDLDLYKNKLLSSQNQSSNKDSSHKDSHEQLSLGL